MCSNYVSTVVVNNAIVSTYIHPNFAFPTRSFMLRCTNIVQKVSLNKSHRPSRTVLHPANDKFLRRLYTCPAIPSSYAYTKLGQRPGVRAISASIVSSSSRFCCLSNSRASSQACTGETARSNALKSWGSYAFRDLVTRPGAPFSFPVL